MLRGRCLCGLVAWQAVGEPEQLVHCHCSMCRKAHGAPFASALLVPRPGFEFLRGQERVTLYESSPGNRRGFCSICGSVVPVVKAGSERLPLAAGCLDGDPGPLPGVHIFTGSKAVWHEITDDLPSFEEYPPEWDLPVSDVERASPAVTPGAIGGSCCCGDVSFELTGALDGIKNCHCSRCRRAASAAHDSILAVARAGFRWLSGEKSVRDFKLPEARSYRLSFCERCGSLLPGVVDGRDGVGLPASALDDDPGLRQTHHIFCGSKAPWYEITDGLPQFDEYPPASFRP